MERLVASDGGRIVKSGLLAFGALISAAPAFAQSSADPLAPLPVSPAVALPVPPAAHPTVQQQPGFIVQQPDQTTVAPLPPPVAAIVVPTDWRGVFDAIDSGNWVSAQAGIATLPRNILTPVAK